MDLTVKMIVLILLIYSTYTDIKSKEIMMIPVYICILISVAGTVMEGNISIISFEGAVPGILMLIASFLTKGAIGEGDAYLILAIGLMVGIRNVVVILLIGSVFAMLYGVFLLFFRKAKRKDTISYVPFILTGFIGVMLIA